jgi:Ala-tRNA(Pro) deacylase
MNIKIISFECVLNFLESCCMPYKLVEINAGLNDEQISKMIGVNPSQEAKSLLLIKDGVPCFAIIGRSNKIDFKKMKEFSGAKKIDMATPIEVKEITGLEVGSVPPFGNLIDIPIYLDLTLSKESKIAFSAGMFNKIIVMSTSDYVKITKPQIFDYIKK